MNWNCSNPRAVIAASIVLAAIVGGPASAQAQAPEQAPVSAKGLGPAGPPGIHVAYKEPTDPNHKSIYERLKRRGVLEDYREFMSPLRLPSSLNVSLEGCEGRIGSRYVASTQTAADEKILARWGRIVLCYESIARDQQAIAATNLLAGFRREDAAVGGFVGVLLHETGHAIFHLLGIPIFGREEDAADAVGSYVALQFGPATARRILSGRAFVWRARELAGNSWGPSRRFADYADEHGTNAQRFYNTLCIALGSDEVEGTTTFAEFKDLLPEFRRGHCRYEYEHVKRSFAHFVLPHLDMERVVKVRAREWLRSEDGTDIPALAGLAPGGRSAMDSDLLLGILVVVALLAVPVIAIAGLWLAIAGRRRIRAVEQRLTALQEGQAVTADAAAPASSGGASSAS